MVVVPSKSEHIKWARHPFFLYGSVEKTFFAFFWHIFLNISKITAWNIIKLGMYVALDHV